MTEQVTVVVVDDHPFFRDGVRRALQDSGRIRVVGEAADGRAGLDMIRQMRPDVAVVDHQMPELTGTDLAHALARDGGETRVLMLSAVVDAPVVYRALQEGARGYLSKESGRDDIVAAVLAVAKGSTVMPPDLAAALVGEIHANAAKDSITLSERESQVLHGFARGQSIPQIAAEHFIAASTVKTHTQRLYEKLGVSDRAAAVAEGMRRKLID
ncbi:response regulator [Gordonia spumicola]|nr:response regulator transcription factor [Gordonia spumicola]